MPKKISRTEAKKQIKEFFLSIKGKTPKEVKKIKKLAMSFNLPLKEKRKTFCKKCLDPYKAKKIRIRNNIKSVACGDCGYVSRWKIK
jgi:RNase P subunit RPR2